MNIRTSALCASLFLTVTASRANDWPQWRGPNRDGIIIDKNHALNQLPAEPKVLWKIAAGPGQSSPVLAGGKLVFLDLVGEEETVHCLDAASGKELWKTGAGPRVVFSPDYGGGPRCTPLVDGDRIYTQTGEGEFRCLDLATGKLLWRINFGADFGATWFGNKSGDPAAKETASRRHGNNGSAVIDGGQILVPVGSPDKGTLMAFDKKAGKLLWAAGNDNTAYSSVMVATLAGVRQAVHLTADALMGVDVATGKVLWREPLKTGAKRHACTPVIVGDTVTVSSSTIGTIKFQITKEGGELKAQRAWAALPVKTNLTTPVVLQGKLYTLSAGDRTALTCLDFETGNELWKQPGFSDYAALTVVNDKLLALNSTGELFLVKIGSANYEEVGRVQLCAKTWASPAYADGRIFVKDEANLTAFALAK